MTTDNKKVSGPINVVRLEGGHKVLYVFMDFHKSLNQQMECTDIRSQQVVNFLVTNLDKMKIKNPNKIYDIMVEKRTTDLLYVDEETNKPYQYVERHIIEVWKLFDQLFDRKQLKGVIQLSSQLTNARFHYIDAREWVTNSATNMIDKLLSHKHLSSINGLVHFLDSLNLISKQMTSVYMLLYDKKTVAKASSEKLFTKYGVQLSKYSDTELQSAMEKLITKIKKSYKHDNVENEINKIIKNELHNNFELFFKDLKKIMKKISKYSAFLKPYKNVNIRKTLIKQSDSDEYFYGVSMGKSNEVGRFIKDSLNKLNIHLIGPIGGLIMDLYFIRRFMDKDYITNAISYTGAYHSNNYIRILVKYFGFRITHTAYLNEKYTLDQIHEEIMKSKSSNSFGKYFFPKTFTQCSDLTGFPELFE